EDGARRGGGDRQRHSGDARRLAHGAARPAGTPGKGGGAGRGGIRTGVRLRAPARGTSGPRRGARGSAREAGRGRALLRAGYSARVYVLLQTRPPAGRGIRLAPPEPTPRAAPAGGDGARRTVPGSRRDAARAPRAPLHGGGRGPSDRLLAESGPASDRPFH